MDDIRKCGISCLKLHRELLTEQLHDVGAEKISNFDMLSRESL